MDKLISIIIPVYNVEQYLNRCFDSLLAQTYKNFEVLIVDDGSPDNSGAICDEYAKKDPRFKVLHTENGGVCAARNKALEMVQGDYIGFVDPDDECTPDMFEYLMNGAEKYGAGITCCRYYRVVPGKITTSRCDGRTRVMQPEEAMEELVNYFIIRNVFWNKLFRKDVFDGIKFPEGRIYEGTAMIYKLIEKTDKLTLLGDPKYYYYANEGSYIYTKTFKHALDFSWAHITRYNDIADKYPQLKEKLLEDIYPILMALTGFNNAGEEEREKHKDDIAMIEKFYNAHKSELDEVARKKKKAKGGFFSFIAKKIKARRK